MTSWRCEKINLAATINLAEEAVYHRVLLEKGLRRDEQPLRVSPSMMRTAHQNICPNGYVCGRPRRDSDGFSKWGIGDRQSVSRRIVQTDD